VLGCPVARPAVFALDEQEPGEADVRDDALGYVRAKTAAAMHAERCEYCAPAGETEFCALAASQPRIIRGPAPIFRADPARGRRC
jgi:hypothetical protein